MNLCIVAYKFGTEKEIGEHLGTYHYFIEKMRTLVKKGHKVHVVAPWISLTKKGSMEVDGVEVVRYWPPMLNFFWVWPINRIIRWLYIKKTQKQVLKTVKAYTCDAVYVYQARETGYAIAQIKEKLNIPFVFRQITAWKWHFERSISDVFGKRRWYKMTRVPVIKGFIDVLLKILLDTKSQKKFAHTIYSKADKVVFLSRAASKEGIEAGLDERKINILGIAIEEDIFTPLSDKKGIREKLEIAGEKIILFIGRLNFAEKGIGYLVECIPEVVGQIPGAKLVVIGSGEDERAQKLVKELKIENHVDLLGKKPFNSLVDYIQASDVFVVPSTWMEAFGQVTIEAMSCGVPVVTSDAGASPEINIDRETGFIVPAKDSKALAKAIIEIIENEDLQTKMGAAARRRVKENYTYDKITDNFLNIIKRT